MYSYLIKSHIRLIHLSDTKLGWSQKSISHEHELLLVSIAGIAFGTSEARRDLGPS